MQLYFENVELLKYDHTPVVCGAGARYKVEKKLTIVGEIIDKHGSTGVGRVISHENLILAGAIDYNDIYLNSVFFGKGKILSVKFAGGNLTQRERYNYEIECFEETDLSSILGGVYTGIDWSNARLIDHIDETLSYQLDEEQNKTYTHSIAVRFNEQTPGQNITLAKALAANLFGAKSGLGAFLAGFDLTGIQKYYTETYNMVDGNATFLETAEIPAIQNGHYSSAFTYELQQDEQGFTTVTEKCEITGLTYPKAASANEGYAALAGGTYARSNAVYQAYGFSTLGLYHLPISKAVVTNKFEGKISLTTVFSNNPKYQDFAIWEHTIKVDRNEQNVFVVAEEGTVTGIGKVGTEKYNNALSYFTTVAAGIDSRLDTAYSNAGGTHSLITVGNSKTLDSFNGKISYSRTRTDDNLFTNGSMRKEEISVSISNPVHLNQKYNIFNNKEIVQTQNQITIGRAQVSIHLKGVRGTDIPTYLGVCSTLIAPYTNLGTDSFLGSCDYTLTPKTNDFTLNAEYVFGGTFKAQNDLTIT